MEIDNLKKTMCYSSPSCTEEVPRAQKKPTTEGSPKYVKTTPVLESKGPKGEQDKQRKDYWSGTKPSPSPNTGPKRKQNPMNTQFKEKILDVLKLSPGHKGKSPPLTDHRIAENSLRNIYQTKGNILTKLSWWRDQNTEQTMLDVIQHEMLPITGLKSKTLSFASPKSVGALTKDPNTGPKGKAPLGGDHSMIKKEKTLDQIACRRVNQ